MKTKTSKIIPKEPKILIENVFVQQWIDEARQEGKAQEQERILKIIEKYRRKSLNVRYYLFRFRELIEEIKGGEK